MFGKTSSAGNCAACQVVEEEGGKHRERWGGTEREVGRYGERGGEVRRERWGGR